MGTRVAARICLCTAISIAALSFLCCEAFLLADDCPAAAPCTCSGSGSFNAYISCHMKFLNDTPPFRRSSIHFLSLDVNLYRNNLKTIQDYAFKNLSSINAETIKIRLDDNKISSVGRNAFSGIENITDYLDLSSNNLSSIPTAVGNLSALKTLYIENNPLTSLGVSNQSEITRSLKTLSIDLKEFSEWPKELSLLHNLKALLIRYVNFPNLNADVFQSSLTYLYIEHASTLDKIPNAICKLSNLQSLTLYFFINLTANSSSIFANCSKPLDKVITLSLRHNHLSVFPDIFPTFPSLTSLYVSENTIDIIETEKIPKNNVLSNMDLERNKLKRIPNALNRLKMLTRLYIVENDIFSVEDNDLSGLVNLEQLYLSRNPVKYISIDAFKNNKKLTSLHLDSTHLKQIPAAILSLPKLSNFDITNTHDPITCTCDMSYLIGWNASAVQTFNGQCAFYNITIQNYIMSSLQQCI